MVKKYLKKNFLDLAMLLINTAEKDITGQGRGADRMAWCVAELRARVPRLMRWMVTDELVAWLVQRAFDLMRNGITVAQAADI